jgi:hypothetical protein
MKALIIATLTIIVVGLISGCGSSTTSLTSSAVTGEQNLPYQILSSSLALPENVSPGVYVFRSTAEWSNFWNGQTPVLSFLDFTTNSIIAAVSIGTEALEITGLQTSPSGVIIDAIKIDGIGTIPINNGSVRTPDGQIITIPPITLSGGPHALIIAKPTFSGEANLNITSTYLRP